MKRVRGAGFVIAGLMLMLMLTGARATPGYAAPRVTATPIVAARVYVVQTGDTLFAIAVRYGVSLTELAQINRLINPNLIYPGQTLMLPPAGVSVPEDETLYTVQAGDTLFALGLRFKVSYVALAQANGLTYPYWIYVGQRLRIPRPVPPGTTPTPAPHATLTPVPGGFGYGIDLVAETGDSAPWLDAVERLGLGWVRLEIDWARYAPARGQIDWAALDARVLPAATRGMQILLTVSGAPAWARATTAESGPPVQYADYAEFVGALAGRYRGRVAAYEIWRDQNLARAWQGDTLDPARYVALLRAAYPALKAQDADAQVIAGALAPSALNDGVRALDDRAYLRGMYAAGVAEVSDGIGVQAWSWANAPESYCCHADASVSGYDDHPNFFFRHTVEDAHLTMAQYGDGTTLVWVTDFGWAAPEAGSALSADLAWAAQNTAVEQGDFARRAYAMGRAYVWVGPMFLHALNGCATDANLCLFSLARADGTWRPGYETLRGMPKP